MKKLVLGLVIGLVVGVVSVAVAQTTTTSADFCVKDNGKLRLAMDGTCGSGEQLLTIEGAQGPPGPAGQDGVDGTDGVDGQDGVDGADGIDGTDGVDGVSGYEIVTQVASWGEGGVQRQLTMTCPAGKKVVGAGHHGGSFTVPGGNDDETEINEHIWESHPVDAGSGWHFHWVGDFSGAALPFTHFIICVDA